MFIPERSWHFLLLSAAILLLGGCAATTPHYQPPAISGNEPMIVVSGTKAFSGSGCLSTIVIDGKAVGTVGAYEACATQVEPGQHFVRWDVVGGGLCGHTEDIAHRLVTIKDGPVLLKLDISGLSKAFIPIYGLFTQPEYRILMEGEE